MNTLKTLIAVSVLAGFSVGASATIVSSVGAGSAVTSVDATMNFELSNNGPYTENGLSYVNVNSSYGSAVNACGFAGCAWHFNAQGMSGNNSYGLGSGEYAELTRVGGGDFTALEAVVGTGYSYNDFYAKWEAFNDSVLVGSGLEHLFKGTILGFSGPDAFDTLRIATYANSNIDFTGTFNATALDQVHGQFGSAVHMAQVSEPGTMMLLGLGMVGLWSRSRVRKSTVS